MRPIDIYQLTYQVPDRQSDKNLQQTFLYTAHNAECEILPIDRTTVNKSSDYFWEFFAIFPQAFGAFVLTTQALWIYLIELIPAVTRLYLDTHQ